ncbi:MULTISPECIES: FtsX-like permease family protein [Cryobacterium]|uniref:ABC transporter permease n=2 Tax=Cryobacterium TaxID=69578 RepID=A0A4R9AV71_9MICO|nr:MULTISPECIES: FtsX-like permease family protein [Cryobacterium]TFD66301.1 ABC transporter permease [Cryobacterium ruanii]TFD70630.1 ABC transporter permease [Cryobacterium gelidum]
MNVATGAGRNRASVLVAFRLARRMAVQNIGRSVLVVALIAIPVLGMTGIATLEASNNATPAEQVRFRLGQTVAEITAYSPPDKTLTQDPTDPSQTASSTDNTGTPTGYEAGAALLDPTTYAPSGDKLLTIQHTTVTATTAHGVGYIPAVQGEPWNPAFTGKWDIVDGRAPQNDREVMVSPGALTRLGENIGGQLLITAPETKTFTIVGTLQSAALTTDADAVYGMSSVFNGVTPTVDLSGTEFYIPTGTVDLTTMEEINQKGGVVYSRDLVLNPPATADSSPWATSATPNYLIYTMLALLGCFALFEVCLLAGAAFAVNASQQQVALAVLASVGADRKTIFRVMTFGGVGLGLIGSLVGVGAGLGVTAIALRVVAAGQATRFPGFHVDLAALIGIVVLATFAGWAAAAVPARSASRPDVVRALRGARRPVIPTHRRPLLGGVLIAVGAVVSIVGGVMTVTGATPVHGLQNITLLQAGIALVVVGPVTMQIGAILIAPLLLRMSARLVSRFGAGARLGSRDAARNTARSVPTVSAIMSTVFIAAFAMSLLGGAQQLTTSTYGYSLPVDSARVTLYGGSSTTSAYVLENVAPAVKDAMRSSFGTSNVVTLSSSESPLRLNNSGSEATITLPTPRVLASTACTQDPTCYSSALETVGGYAGDKIWVGSESDLSAILGQPVNAAAAASLRSGGAVALYSSLVQNGHATFDWSTNDTSNVTKTIQVPAVVQSTKHPVDFPIFITPSTATSLGITFRPTAVFAQFQSAPTTNQKDALQQALQGIGSGQLVAQIETGPPVFAGAAGWALVAAAGVLALGASAIAISLARAEGRRDDDVLTSMGAPPRLRRLFAFWHGILLAGTGSIIGVVFGVVPAAALSLETSQAAAVVPFAPPWAQLALTAVGIPLFIATGAFITTRSHSRGGRRPTVL